MRNTTHITGKILSWLAVWYVRLLRWTCPVHYVGENYLEQALSDGRKVIGVFWHGRITVPLMVFGNRGAPVLVSEHRDGEVIARAIELLGYRTIRGSSTRGGSEALVRLTAYLRDEGSLVGITPDGPTGPARRMKPGIVRLAQKANAVIVPIASTCNKPRYLRSWDRFMIVRPFMPCYLQFGKPITVTPTATAEAFDAECSRVESAIRAEDVAVERWNAAETGPEWRLQCSGPMPMRPRWFWGPFSNIFEGIYHWGLRRQQRQQISRRLPCRVISVGNLSVGGTGKTPVTQWLAALLQSRGYTPAILTRGYRRRNNNLQTAAPHGAATVDQVGDEAVISAARGIPVVVGADRHAAGLRAIQEFHADVCILDDGFQHWRLQRDCDIVLVDGLRGFGNRRLLPAGWLREPVQALERASAVIITRVANPKVSADIRQITNAPILTAAVQVDGLIDRQGVRHEPAVLQGRSVVLVAGVGNFYGVRVTAESLGCIITNGVPKRDHHRYTMADGRKIVQCFRTNEAGCILTTEKDMAKLAPVLNPAIPLYAMQISMNVQGDLHALEKLLVGNEKGV